MINNVKTYTHSDYNPFNKDGGAYYITKQTMQDIYEDNKKKEVIKQKTLGIIIGNIALFSALGAFLLFKGLPTGVYRKLRDLLPKLEEKYACDPRPTPKQRFRTKMLKWMHTKVEQTRSVNNFTSFKDLLFKKLMYKTKFTARIHDGITNIFERLSKGTVLRKYGVFEDSYAGLEKTFDKIKLKEPNKPVTINGVTKTAQEWIEQTRQIRGSVSKQIKENFGPYAIESRYVYMKTINEGLEERVLAKSRESVSKEAKLNENLRALKNSDVAQTFIAEDILAPEKRDLGEYFRIARQSLTRNVNDDYKAAKVYIDEFKEHVDLDDTLVRSGLIPLEGDVSRYKDISGADEAKFRDFIRSDIFTRTAFLREDLKSTKFKYDEKTMERFTKCLDGIENIFCYNKKGDFQELLTIYKHLLPRAEYEKLRSKTDSCTKKLDKAIKTESDEFFDKLRDLKLGAAPTDVLTILTSLGSVGLGLGLAKDKDERISAALKYGIPVVGGIATTLVMTSSLVSGFKGMAAGILSSILLGEMGDITDKFRKNIKKRKEEMKQNEQIINQEKIAKENSQPEGVKPEIKEEEKA